MRVYFLDSSALAKRYVTEQGSAWIQQLTDVAAGHLLVVSRLTWVEVISALSRLRREQTLSVVDVDNVLQAFAYDWKVQYQIVEFDEFVAHEAGELLKRHPLRAYDAVQLASAYRLLRALGQNVAYPYTFLTADNRLLLAAQHEGLLADNPNKYS
jgi:uncharacterized protein